jgi:hypothetical protein
MKHRPCFEKSLVYLVSYLRRKVEEQGTRDFIRYYRDDLNNYNIPVIFFDENHYEVREASCSEEILMNLIKDGETV